MTYGPGSTPGLAYVGGEMGPLNLPSPCSDWKVGKNVTAPRGQRRSLLTKQEFILLEDRKHWQINNPRCLTNRRGQTCTRWWILGWCDMCSACKGTNEYEKRDDYRMVYITHENGKQQKRRKGKSESPLCIPQSGCGPTYLDWSNEQSSYALCFLLITI